MGTPFPITKGSWVYLTKNERKVQDAIFDFVLEHQIRRKNKYDLIPITHLQKHLREKFGTNQQTSNKMIWMMIAKRNLRIKQFGRNRLIYI